MNSSGTVTLTVAAPAQIAALHPAAPLPGPGWGFESSFFLAAGLLFAKRQPGTGLKRFRAGMWIGILAIVLVVLLAAVGCGGGGSSAVIPSSRNTTTTSSLTGTVTIQAISGSLTHSVILPVTVN